MPKDAEKSLGGPTAILLLIGGIFTVILFYFMFQFAEQENLFMVILTALLIGAISMVVAKGLVRISRRK
jgi:RsiW-degrading membrane proteinase PrsW (M82 family)